MAPRLDGIQFGGGCGQFESDCSEPEAKESGVVMLLFGGCGQFENESSEPEVEGTGVVKCSARE